MVKYNIVPVAKPRMTQSDKWKKRPAVMRYRHFCDLVRVSGVLLPNGSSVIFELPMPKSWSKKKRLEMNGKPHQQKPDLDNLLKALADAVHEEDCTIWHYGELIKVWAEEGSIIVS